MKESKNMKSVKQEKLTELLLLRENYNSLRMRLSGNLDLASWDFTTAALVSEVKSSTCIVSVSVSVV